MNAVKRLWLLGWKVALVAGFAGLAGLGLFLMATALLDWPGLFWGPIVFLLGLGGVLMVLGTVLTVLNRPESAAT